MSENNEVTTEATTEATLAKLYATHGEAKADKPEDATKYHKIFEIAKAGAVVGYVWARGYEHALAFIAKRDGYTASMGSKTKEVTKEQIEAKLATFTDEELAAMGLSRKPAKKGSGK